MPFNKIPAVDENNLFPTPIRQALAGSAEFSQRDASILKTGIVPEARIPLRIGEFAAVTTDWNTAVKTGWYQGNGAANAPTAGIIWFTGMVEAHNDTYVTQTLHQFTGDSATATQAYRRAMDNGVWGAWYRLLMSQTELDARYVARWFPSTAYLAGQQVLSPKGELLTSKTARTSGATWNATEVSNWKGLDKSMMLVNGGFSWSGGVTSWDAGPLTVDTTGMNQQTAGEAFCSPGSISGTVKFLEPGNYDMFWYVTPGADPGNAGYRINASSTGTAWPLPAMDNSGIVMGSGNRMAGQLYWESTVIAVGIKVDLAGQEVRLQGVQQNASTNKALVKVVKRSSI